jgi:hypothetical protein
MDIHLNDILTITAPEEYKLHLACQNPDGLRPLDDFVADPARWVGWNAWRGGKNDWTRPRILSFMEFYPRTDGWLFGGAFEVVERRSDSYKLQQVAIFEKYIGRLLASFHRYQGMRGRAFKLESYLDQLIVAEVLPQLYSGESFPGFESIDHDFGFLEAVFRAQRADWKAVLENVKGVYLIADKSNGTKYVGAAYGDAGIWSRWSCYIGTGHGWNDELVALLRQKGPKYARDQFRFSVLEVMVKSTPDEVVLAREAHWKRVLLTREHGYNKN